ncbi:hypothetical protein DYQ86_03945 [Acidobacteria bacterium AB60]|nr:hypothetical protein DYQ86_03945 [Acidobacteria bacterium AB60]
MVVFVMLAMLCVPAGLTLHTARVAPQVPGPVAAASPYGYSVSLLLFLVPIVVILFWLVPAEHLKISKKAFVRTIGLLFPLGAGLDFFFARRFLTFPNPEATLRIPAPAIGGSVPIEEYLFYLTGFVAVLLLYIWLDEYWVSAYSVPVDSAERTNFARLLQFHPWSLIVGVVLMAGAIVFRKVFVAEPGFPGYFVFLVAGALTPSALLLPSAKPVINWRALSLTMFFILLMSLMWEATLGLPYGWWGFQEPQMLGIFITAWSRLPIEEVVVWIAVTYATCIVYEVVRRWQSSGKRLGHAFLGSPGVAAEEGKDAPAVR